MASVNALVVDVSTSQNHHLVLSPTEGKMQPCGVVLGKVGRKLLYPT